jgi:hypothetical protein
LLGTAFAHWESRILLGDYMIGLSFDDIAISEITLALFEDSGWYKTNKYTGGLFKFGKNEGCFMLEQKCLENNIPISKKSFCVKSSESICQTNLLGRGFCYISSTSNPDNDNYVYFQDNKRKGGLFIADYCPIIAVPTDNSYFYNWNCKIGKSIYPKEYSEKISTTSACFMSNASQTSSLSYLSTNSYRATCYPFFCDLASNQLKVFIGESVVYCPPGGGELEVENYTGKIICPDFYSICSYNIPCNDIYDCVIKSSEPANRVLDYIPKESFTVLPKEQIIETKQTNNTLIYPSTNSNVTKLGNSILPNDKNNSTITTNNQPKINPVPPKDLIFNYWVFININLLNKFIYFSLLIIFIIDLF